MIRVRAINSNPARVALLTTYHQPCGLATYADYLSTALRDLGVEPLILAEHVRETTKPDTPNVLRCWSRDPMGGSEILTRIEQENITLLHVNFGGIFPPNGWLVSVMRDLRAKGIRILTTFHSTEARVREFARICENSDRVLVHFPQNIVQLTALGADPSKISVMPHGLPEIASEDLATAKRRVRWHPDQPYISTFGFVESHKGIIDVIRAVHELSDIPNLSLFVAGTAHPHNPESRKYLDACANETARLGIQERVRFADRFLTDEQVGACLQASDAIVMNYQSRRFEASGAGAVALASGRPVVTSQAPAFDYPVALTIKTSEQRSLADCIRVALTNPTLREQLLRNLRNYEQEAGWPVVAARTAAIYRDCLKEGSGEARDAVGSSAPAEIALES